MKLLVITMLSLALLSACRQPAVQVEDRGNEYFGRSRIEAEMAGNTLISPPLPPTSNPTYLAPVEKRELR